MLYLGIDIGSSTCDAVLIDDHEQIIAWKIVPTGARNIEAIEQSTNGVLQRAGVRQQDVAATIATGYGRSRVEGRLASVTEISCHARGICALLPRTRVLMDIGGQDSKAIRIDGLGRVADFAMNDKCAAGTGRFLEAMASALQVEVKELAPMGEGAAGSLTLSSMCTVFAESEVVSLIAEGTEVAEIVDGLHRAIAQRAKGLVKRVAPNLAGLHVSMSGGVARNPGVVRALGRALGCEISVPSEPDIVGALGAALIARERANR
jgi:predicted CoA-substrate-specific enzyme activase